MTTPLLRATLSGGTTGPILIILIIEVFIIIQKLTLEAPTIKVKPVFFWCVA